MRELKFRAWKMRNGKLQRYVCTPFGLLDYAHKHPEAPVLHYIEVNDIRDFMPDADIIEQYTGLKDKNGKEIYEGDIMSDKTVVEFSNDTDVIGSCGCCIPRFFGSGFTISIDSRPEYLEVIGNIHENPDLLKEVNKI